MNQPRIIVPIVPHRRRATRAELVASFAAACVLVAFSLIVIALL